MQGRIEEEICLVEEIRYRKAKRQQKIALDTLQSVASQEIKRRREYM